MNQNSFVIGGGGFYGVCLAGYLKKRFPRAKVTILEASSDIMSRATQGNQARVHNGYHYPRALGTARASAKSYQRFKEAWPSAIFENFRHIYGVSRNGSQVTQRQFAATMFRVGAPLRELRKQELGQLFDPSQIEGAFEVDEAAFNHLELRLWGVETLDHHEIELRVGERVKGLRKKLGGGIEVHTEKGELIAATFFFNTTYGGLEYIDGLREETGGLFRHQATEMQLIDPPISLEDMAITVVDGPFFSLMPFPSRSCHSLSHVRYTPRYVSEGRPLPESWYFQKAWPDEADVFNLMVRDSSRFVPAMADSKKLGTLREVKTLFVGARNDARPILVLRHRLNGCFSILGSKLDNVFDMFDYLDELSFE